MKPDGQNIRPKFISLLPLKRAVKTRLRDIRRVHDIPDLCPSIKAHPETTMSFINICENTTRISKLRVI